MPGPGAASDLHATGITALGTAMSESIGDPGEHDRAQIDQLCAGFGEPAIRRLQPKPQFDRPCKGLMGFVMSSTAGSYRVGSNH